MVNIIICDVQCTTSCCNLASVFNLPLLCDTTSKCNYNSGGLHVGELMIDSA